ncbi:hypothetical protein FA95DRAFT_1481999 [Auriscalpium vulgare]|uniref:Uncharacterized protein n=1 Tax=Auriscalpium vulgare TaxID=40419 RepID=A0ACB8SA03_9AGAM|nr:hypothetical protein FA95DRAFT_1481999 [Auriscalpium vulgare]
MFSKTLVSYVTLFLAVATSVQAHAAISPALGVEGVPVRSDVQRPSVSTPCGKVNVAGSIGASTSVAATADGKFTFDIKNFNAGRDGSRQLKSISVDPTGTGKKFVAAKVVSSGDLAPTSVGTQKVVGQLPAGMKCTGGKSKNSCVVSFVTQGGFGNCGVVSQGSQKRDDERTCTFCHCSAFMGSFMAC